MASHVTVTSHVTSSGCGPWGPQPPQSESESPRRRTTEYALNIFRFTG